MFHVNYQRANFYWHGKLHPISNHIKVRYQDTPEGEFQVSAKTAYERYMSNNPKRELREPIEQEMAIDQDSDKTIYLLLNIKSPITRTWYLTYGLTEDRRRALLKSSHNDGLTNQKSETSLTLFVLGNIDGWEQIENLAVLPRVQSNSDWNGDFFDNIHRETSNFHPDRTKVNHLWDAVLLLVDNLYEYSRSALDNSYLLFEFEIVNPQFHSIPTELFKELSFFDISSKTKWSKFDAVLILPTIKRFIFIESKLNSDIRLTVELNGENIKISQITRAMESAYLFTHHPDSNFHGWEYDYLFICPRQEYESGKKEYSKAIPRIQNPNLTVLRDEYLSLKEKIDPDPVKKSLFDDFLSAHHEHIHVLFWDQLFDVLEETDPGFLAKYMENIQQLKDESMYEIWLSRIKNFLHLDYPCGKTTGYYAKVMLLRSTGNFYILYNVTLWQATGNSQVKTCLNSL